MAALLLGSLVYLPLPGWITSVKPGMSAGQVDDLVGEDQPVSRLAVAGVEPPRPPGTVCRYVFLGTRLTENPVIVDRYCLRAGRVTEIRTLRLSAPSG
ncbi:hypothetical protein [Rhizohabitans arisaemae]|uniref:hypothetical protein n=1 Tax=Rhizohabitans arisaemae TaxID=2720610 RepID=UPI0024B1E891|nr:hypothetical protein [Rhizohabitans arisaemae]